MDTIKILAIKNKELKKGGPGTFQENMLYLFNRGNFRCFLIMDDFDEKFKIKNKCLLICIIKYLLRNIYLIMQIRKYIKYTDYLFIPTFFRYGLLAILTSLLFKIPFIVPILGWEEKELKLRDASKIEIFFRLKYESWVFRRATFLLTSKDLMEEYRKIVRDKNKFIVTDSPVNTNIFKPGVKSNVLKNKLGISDKKVILTVTSLAQNNPKSIGLKKLIEAFILVKKEYNDVVLLIAGEGSQKDEVEKLTEKMNLTNNVKFLGYYNNIYELINSSDIFTLIFPFGGGIGSAIKEAMACEIPCVISNTSGTEVLKDREEVLLVDYDVNDIADKILLLLKDEKLARNIGINARKRIEKDFSIEKVANKIAEKLEKYRSNCQGSMINRRRRDEKRN